MKQLRKCHASRGHRKVENLDVGWRVCEVVSLAALQVRLRVRSVRLTVSLCDLYGSELGTQRPQEPTISPSRTSPHSPTLYLRPLSFILPRTHSTSLSSFLVLFKPPYNLFAFWISSMLHTSPALPIPLHLIRLVAFGVGSYQNRYHERQKTSRA